MTGLDAESAGTMAAALRAIDAIEQAAVPWCSVIIRRAFGVAGEMLGPRHGPDGYSLNHRYAWPVRAGARFRSKAAWPRRTARKSPLRPIPVARRPNSRRTTTSSSSPLRTAERFGVARHHRAGETRKVLCDWVEDAFALSQGQLGLRLRTMR